MFQAIVGSRQLFRALEAKEIAAALVEEAAAAPEVGHAGFDRIDPALTGGRGTRFHVSQFSNARGLAAGAGTR